MKPVYYHLFDLDMSEVMETGKNSRSLLELKEELLSYISVDFPEEDDGSQEWKDWKKIKTLSVEEICEMWNIAIQGTSNKI